MVPSKVEDQVIARLLSHRDPIVITESAENVVNPLNGEPNANGTVNGAQAATATNGNNDNNTAADANTTKDVKGR